MITANRSSNAAIEGGIDVTPLIDIIFILLVFLMLTANTQLFALPVDVPEQGQQQAKTLENTKQISINIMASAPYWALNGKSYADFGVFKRDFIEQYRSDSQAKVIIAADKKAEIQPLMQLLAMLREQQISQTQILMEP